VEVAVQYSNLMKTKTLTTYDILELEAKAAQDKINAIKKLLSTDKKFHQDSSGSAGRLE